MARRYRGGCEGPGMDMHPLLRLLEQQADLLSRAQVLEHGGSDNDIARMLRRREWSQVHPGVYVGHTGPLTREQHEWAAVLYCAPAALTGRSALRKYGVRVGREGDRPAGPEIVHVAVARHRRVESRPGIEPVCLSRFEEDVLENLSPPRVRLEHVVLDVASASREESAAVAVSGILIARGWDSQPTACSAMCPVGSICGGQHAPGASQAPQIG